MANADQVVVELVAKLDGFNQAVTGAAAVFDKAIDRTVAAAEEGEKVVSDTEGRKVDATETASKARISAIDRVITAIRTASDQEVSAATSVEAAIVSSNSAIGRSAAALEAILAQMGDSASASFQKVGRQASQSGNILDEVLDNWAIATRKGEGASHEYSVANVLLQSAVRKSVDQFAAGAPIATIFAEHIETLAEYASLSGGSLGTLGEILSGPWGIAATAGISIAASLGAKLLEGSDASDKMSAAQRELATYLDKTTGKVREQISYLALLAASQATAQKRDQARSEYDAARSTFVSRGGLPAQAPITTGSAETGQLTPSVSTVQVDTNIQRVVTGYATGLYNITEATKRLQALVANGIVPQSSVKPLLDAAIAVDAASTKTNDLNLALDRTAVAAGTATAAQRAVVAANVEGSKTSAEHVENLGRLAAAHDAVSKAEAQLRIVEESRAAAEAAGGKALQEYGAQFAAATLAVTNAREAEKSATQTRRDSAKATRDAAKAARELIKAYTDEEIAGRKHLTSFDDQYGPGTRPIGSSDVTGTLDKVASGKSDDIAAKFYADHQRAIQSLASLYETAFTRGAKGIGDALKQALLGAIADALAKKTISGFEGLLGNAASGGGFFGDVLGKLGFGGARASGGAVTGGQLYRVNEGASPGNVEGFRPQGSGTIIPLGRMNPAGGGNSTKVYNITVSADNSVTPAGFAQGLASQILARAQQMDAQTEDGLRKGFPAATARYNTLGTTG